MTKPYAPRIRAPSQHTEVREPCKVDGCRSRKYYSKSGKCVSCALKARESKNGCSGLKEQLRIQKIWVAPCQQGNS